MMPVDDELFSLDEDQQSTTITTLNNNTAVANTFLSAIDDEAEEEEEDEEGVADDTDGQFVVVSKCQQSNHDRSFLQIQGMVTTFIVRVMKRPLNGRELL